MIDTVNEMIRLCNIYEKEKEGKLKKLNYRYGRCSPHKGWAYRDLQKMRKEIKKLIFTLPDGTVLQSEFPRRKEGLKEKREIEKEVSKIFGRETNYNRTCDGKLQYHFPVPAGMVICMDFGKQKDFKIYIHKNKKGYESRVFGFLYSYAKKFPSGKV